MLHYTVVEIAHEQGRGEPADCQKHGEDEAFHQNTHVYDKRDIISFVKEIEVEGLQDVLLAPGHHRRIDKVENSKWYKKKGQCPAEIASEVPVPEVYHQNYRFII